ncbi:sororin isoform X2 [Callorhinchus milii]|uniref:sororin isoform X2 n=1 Tax=Callorhinchus milii TaxID=7868 RepID=UPI001C3F83EC|nr:sororin isoform X2 [Callorhinchus milii]
MSTVNDVSQSVRRRSERLSGAKKNKASPEREGGPGPAPTSQLCSSGMEKGVEGMRRVAVVKHSIVLKKIEPERRLLKRVSGEAAHSHGDSQISKALRRSPRISNQSVKENVDVREAEPAVTGEVGPGRGEATERSGAERGHLSPVALNSPNPRELLMSRKVRRSYSRLSPAPSDALTVLDSIHTSTPDAPPRKRCSLFGFERLLHGEGLSGEEEGLCGEGLGAVSPVMGPSLSMKPPVKPPSDRGPPISPDGNIPGIAVGKEKRKRRKIPQIQVSELEEWAAQMNASFDEAERFPLLVE